MGVEIRTGAHGDQVDDQTDRAERVRITAVIGRNFAILGSGRLHLSGFPGWAAWNYLMELQSSRLIVDSCALTAAVVGSGP